MRRKKFSFVTSLLTAAVFGVSLATALGTWANEPAQSTTQSPTTEPAAGGVIKVGDKEALAANMDKDVTIEGVCSDASWSNSGKVMNIRFQGAEESRFGAVVFQKNKEKIDQSFNGDAAKAWTGAKLRIKGKLTEYGGKAESMKGSLQVIINDASQVTVVDLSTSQPTQ